MTAKIKLNAASGGGSVSLKAPSTTTSNAAVELQLPVADGSADQFIKTDGSGNLSFAAAGGGKILQAVSATTTTTVSNTTETYADTGLTASINISAGSRVLVMCVLQLDVESASNTEARGAVKLVRGSTDIFAPNSNKSIGIEGASSDMAMIIPLHFSFFDTGASTGSNTYKLQGRVANAGNSARIRFQDDNSPSTITLLEVAA